MSSNAATKRALDTEKAVDENGHDAKRVKTEQPAEATADHVHADESDDDDKPVLPTGRTSASSKARKGAECPYLDSVSRQVVDDVGWYGDGDNGRYQKHPPPTPTTNTYHQHPHRTSTLTLRNAAQCL